MTGPHRAVAPEPHPVAARWRDLAAQAEPQRTFSAELTDGLPTAARRWVRHAVADQTPLWTGVELAMEGEIRIGSWRRFSAGQLLVPQVGFIWAATARVAGVPLRGFDSYFAGTVQMRWSAFGRIPIIRADGSDVTRSAAGRLAAEGLALLPTSFASALWQNGPDAATALATVAVNGRCHQVSLRIGPDGRLEHLALPRWGNPDGRPYREHEFAVSFDDERTFDGLTIPSRLRAGWTVGDEQPFFRARITGLHPLANRTRR